jgi:peptidoglycan/xylan/chitin deacetylase (PgdA/CDA1 family)
VIALSSAEPFRFPVMLTFDLDADGPPVPAGPNGEPRPGAISQRAYGAKVAVYRILNLLKSFGLPATFFIPGWVVDHHPDAVRAIVAGGHEIGHHGYTHVPPYEMEEDEERAALLRGIASIERASGRRPVGYRSPAWDFSPATLRLLSENGFLYSSNMMDDDRPYRHGSGLVELPVQWILADSAFLNFRPPTTLPISALSTVWEAWTAEFEGLHAEAAERGTCFVLTMHPQIIGRPGRTALLRRFVEWAMAKPGVEFMRCEDCARRVP